MYELSNYHLALTATGLAIILAYWLPRFFSRREPAASALLIGLGCLTFGIVPGLPAAISPLSIPKLWEKVSELCVVIGLFGVGLRIDKLVDPRGWAPTARLLAVAMPLTILGVAAMGWSLAGMTLGGGLLLGAVLAPTDPVLAGDVQVGRPSEGGEHPVRFTLTAEAGLNDGLAFPFVHLGLAAAAAGTLTLGLLGDWLWRDVAYRIAVGVAGGVAIGWLLGKLLFRFPRKNSLANTEAAVFAMAGALLAYGATELVEGYGFVAAFVAGLALRRVEPDHECHVRLHNFSENVEHAMTALLLIGFGAAMPVMLKALDLTGAAIGLALVFIIRPVVAWVSLYRTLLTGRRRFVVAVYGVRGIGSIYYLAYAGAHLNLTNEAQLWAVIAFTILVSTIVHGFTAAFAVEKATGGARAVWRRAKAAAPDAAGGGKASAGD